MFVGWSYGSWSCGSLCTEDSFVVEKPPDGERKVREVSVNLEVVELLQLTVWILAMFPVEFPPLVSESEAVCFEAVLVDSLQEVGWFSPLDTSPALLILVTRRHQAALVHTNAGQLQSIQPSPDLLGDVLLQQEHQLQVRLIPDVLQTGDLECLEVAGV